jgi:hypothetical protein
MDMLASEVALLVQAKQLTGSPLAVGLLGGQLRSGVVASLAGVRFSLIAGGLACVGAVAAI